MLNRAIAPSSTPATQPQGSTQDALASPSAFRDDRVRGQTEPWLGGNSGLAWAISLASASVLAAALGARWGAAVAAQLGQVSEELFRGDRLPLLNPPLTRSAQTDPTNPVANPADPSSSL